jgi:hypothetical protein
LEHGIANLIYTSTLDVTWNWDGIVGIYYFLFIRLASHVEGPETQNYPRSPANGYIKSKIAAEKLVVDSNGMELFYIIFLL